MSAEATRDRADPRGLLEGYLRYLRIERGLSPHTLRNYRSDLRHFLAFLEASDTVLTAVTPGRLPRVLDGAARGRPGAGEPAPAGEHDKAFFRHLAAEEALPGNPLTLATIPKGRGGSPLCSRSSTWRRCWPPRMPIPRLGCGTARSWRCCTGRPARQ